MVKILSEGDGKHRVEDEHERSIGWVSGRTIGFRGFATEHDAREAAVSARAALDRMLRSQYPGWPQRDTVVKRLRTVHDGAYEWFYDGHAAIARLLRPQRRAYDPSFGIELVLPSFASEGLAVAAAYAATRAVEPHRDELPPPSPRMSLRRADRPSTGGDAA
jgi:hypothetical protein